MLSLNDKSSVRRWATRLGFGLLAGLAASACSDPAEPCDPPIPTGAKYRVTVGAATPDSDGCGVVKVDPPVFEITAGSHDATLGRQACFTTPAATAPPQRSLALDLCRAAQTEQLGAFCDMHYPASCPGQVWFYFDDPAGAPVDWSAPVINAVYKIRDQAVGCIPGGIQSNCVDEYFATLERLP